MILTDVIYGRQINNVPVPIHYYRLEADANDYTESSPEHLIPTDITYGTGLYGSGAIFNGSTSKMSLPNGVLELSPNSREFSITTLSKVNNSSEMRIISINSVYDETYISVRLNAGNVSDRIGVLVYDGEDGVLKTVDGYDLSEGVHIGITAIEDERYNIYVNGNLEYTDETLGIFSTVHGGANYIGTNRNSSGNFLNGMMRGFGIFDVALTPQEMYKIAQMQLTGNQLM